MKVKVAQLCPTFCDPIPCDSLGQNTGVGSLSLLQEIFATQESNPGLLHCKWILYQLSHKGSFMANRWDKLETVTEFIFLGSKITVDGDCSYKIKTLAPWKKSYDKPRQHIKK